MAQIFTPGATLVIKLVLLGGLVLAIAAGLLFYWSMSGPVNIREAAQQPIPFSHKHHVGDDGIDCRYCHTSVERSSFAGLPSSDICMTCHSQIFADAPMLQPLRDSVERHRPLRWMRVNDLPDFVFFDHSIHLAKGVSCVECHGRVDRLPLMRREASLEMQWCLDCHRDPAPHLRPPDKVFDMAWTPPAGFSRAALVQSLHLLDERRRTDCSTCHR